MLTLYTEEHVLPGQSATIERRVLASEAEKYYFLQIPPILEAEISPRFAVKHLSAEGQSSYIRYSLTVINLSDEPCWFVADLLTVAEFDARYGC